MKASSLILIVVVLITVPDSLSSREEDLARAMSLHRRAVGGVDALTSFISAQMTYELSVDNQPQGKEIQIFAGGGRFRYVIEEGSWSSGSFDGEYAYRFNSSSGRAQSPHGPDGGPLDKLIYNRMRSRAVLFPLMSAEKLGARLTRLKDGPGTMVVIADYADGTRRTFTLLKSGLLQKDVTVFDINGNVVTITNVYADHRNIRDGIFPQRTTTWISGTIELGGQPRPLDRTEVRVLKNVRPRIRIEPGYFTEGRPLPIAQGREIDLKGGPAFRFAGEAPTGDDPESIKAADLNGDGNIDITTGDDGEISLLTGDGAGAFTARFSLPAGGGSNEFSLPVDVNGDGVLDIAFVSTSKPAATLFVSLGLGKGRFNQPVAFKTGDFPESIFAADFDSDGNIDLAVAHNQSGDVWIHFGDGGGGFGDVRKMKLSRRGENLVSCDLNSDGRPDLLVVDQNKLTVFINSGDRTFEDGVQYDAGPLPFCLVAADFNNDGKADVLVGNGGIFADQGENDLALLYGAGDGTLEPARFISAGGGITGVDVADFDSDGDLDAAAASFATHECWILLNENGTLVPAGALPCSWSPSAVVSADFNSDGTPDLAVANEYGDNVSIWLGVKK